MNTFDSCADFNKSEGFRTNVNERKAKETEKKKLKSNMKSFLFERKKNNIMLFNFLIFFHSNVIFH